MSKPPSDAGVMSLLATICFWLGSQPLFMGVLAYSKFWLHEGVGYEKGLGGFLGGSVLWAMFSAVPAGVFFVAVLVRLMLFGKNSRVNPVRLCVYSGILGMAWPVLALVFAVCR
jgi:hypothetical protein